MSMLRTYIYVLMLITQANTSSTLTSAQYFTQFTQYETSLCANLSSSQQNAGISQLTQLASLTANKFGFDLKII
jgi:hypothetical protein